MADTRCAVCGLEDDPVLLARCFRCGETFHLNPYSNRPGRDCGDAILGEVEMGVHYYCNPCLEAMNVEAGGGGSTRPGAARAATGATAARHTGGGAPPLPARRPVSRRSDPDVPGTPTTPRAIAPLFLLFAGALAGRVARDLLPAPALGVFDLVIYAGIALSVALAYRRFARRALAAGRRDRQRRERFRVRADGERGDGPSG